MSMRNYYLVNELNEKICYIKCLILVWLCTFRLVSSGLNIERKCDVNNCNSSVFALEMYSTPILLLNMSIYGLYFYAFPFWRTTNGVVLSIAESQAFS